jgi:predicted ATPase
MFEAVVGLLHAACDHSPMLLVLDDLHWADSQTLSLLKHVAAERRMPRCSCSGPIGAQTLTGAIRSAAPSRTCTAWTGWSATRCMDSESMRSLSW